MNKIVIVSFFYSALLLSCNSTPNEDNIEKWKTEIFDTEKDFHDLAQKESIAKAFQTYTAQDANIKRGKFMLHSNDAITEWYRTSGNPNETRIWTTEFVDVSASGDLGYTYGSAVITRTDSTGIKNSRLGKFHRVWKRQADNTWKLVWD